MIIRFLGTFFYRSNRRGSTLLLLTLHIMLFFGVVLSYGEWLSFSQDHFNGSVSERDMLNCTNLSVEPRACHISVAIPGMSKYEPDHRDQRLLADYSLLSFYGSALKVLNNNINGTLRPEKLGQPDIPSIRFHVLVPYSVTKEQISIEISDTDFRTLDGHHSIAPIQQQLFESFIPGVHPDNRIFHMDSNIYGKDAFFSHPVEFDLGICHGYKILEISYCPIQYNPVSKKLMATSNAKVTVRYDTTPVNNDMKPNLFTSAVFKTTFDGITGNLAYRHIEIPRGGKFAIVSGAPLINSQAMKDYIAYRTAQGHEHVKTIDGKTSSASAVTSELKKLYSAGNKGLDFVVVVGDEKVVDIPTGGSKYHYKNWARLEGTDQYEDVLLGIFLCNTEKGMQQIVNRQKWHEAGGTWTKTMIQTAGAEKSENPMARFSSGHYGTKDFDKPEGGLGYTVHRVYGVKVKPTKGYGGKFNIPGPFKWEPWAIDPEPFYTSGSEAVKKVYEYWNKGAFMIQHRDHGSPSGPSKPSIKMHSSITSKSSPLFMSINCSSGHFKGKHTSNFTYLTQSKEIGTCVTVSAPITTMSGDNDIYVIAYYAGVFPKDGTPPERVIGKFHIIGSAKSKTTSRTYFHNFGDAMTLLSVGNIPTPITTPVEQMPATFDVKISGTTLHYQVPHLNNTKSPISIRLYDMKGKMVKTLFDGNKTTGYYSLALDAKLIDLAKGMYQCRLQTQDYVKTVSLTVMK